MKHSLAVDLNGLRFAHPVLAASGCLATGHDVPGLVDMHKLGGVVSRSLTLAPTKGAPTPRAAETPSGLLSAVGLQNPGVEAFVEQDLPRLQKAGVPVIGSVAGPVSMSSSASRLWYRQPGIVALGSCRADHERGGQPTYARLIAYWRRRRGRHLSNLPVFAKPRRSFRPGRDRSSMCAAGRVRLRSSTRCRASPSTRLDCGRGRRSRSRGCPARR
jgi:hypothetical protein